MHKFIADEGNNVMVFNKLIKNVFIRWDKDILPIRTIHGWSAKPATFKDEKPSDVIAEIIINYSGDDLLRFAIPQKFLMDQIDKLRETAMGKWINIRHPMVAIKDIRKLPNDHL